jgi:two-component system sensor histidine kinase ChiS
MRNSILIVDDSEDTLEVFQSTLEEEGFTVMTAKNGEEALDLLKDHEFSLMLLDINMPGMTGLQMLDEMKMRGLGQGVPIMLVSAVDNLGSMKVPPNVIDTLKKPFFYPELIHKLKSVHGFNAKRRPPEMTP